MSRSSDSASFDVVLVGHYGYDNFGDDLLAAIVADAVSSQSSSRRIAMVVARRTNHFDRLSERYQISLLGADVAYQSSVKIVGGGGLYFDFGSRSSIISSSILRLPAALRILAARAVVKLKARHAARARRVSSSVQTIAVGIGIGPFSDKSRRLVTSAGELSKASQIWTRDTLSADTLSSFFGGRVNAMVGADLAFALDLPSVEKKARSVAIVPRGGSSFFSDAEVIEATLRTYSSIIDLGLTPVVVTLGGPEDEAIREQISSKCLHFLFYNGDNLEEVSRELLNSEVVISMRLHGLIVGALGSAKLIHVGFDQKLVAGLTGSWPSPAWLNDGTSSMFATKGVCVPWDLSAAQAMPHESVLRQRSLALDMLSSALRP